MCSPSFISLTVAITTDMPNSSIQILLMPAKLVDVAGILPQLKILITKRVLKYALLAHIYQLESAVRGGM